MGRRTAPRLVLPFAGVATAVALLASVPGAHAEPTAAGDVCIGVGNRCPTWLSKFHDPDAASRSDQFPGVAGVSGAGGDLDYVTAAYAASDGRKLWTDRYTGVVAGGSDSPFGLAVDPLGRFVYVTGWSDGVVEFDIDYATVAYAIAGETATRAWVARFDGIGEDLPDRAAAITVDPAGGRVFVTGDSVRSGFRCCDYATVAYDAVTGAEFWRARWGNPGPGPSAGYNGANAVVVDPGGVRVFVTGQSANSSTARDNDFGTVAYSAVTGGQLWARQDSEPTYDGDFAVALAVAPNGSRVYATGVSSSSNQQGLADQLTIAYGASDGIPAWTARLNASGLDNDRGTAIGVTPDGRSIVTAGQFRYVGLDLSGRGNDYDVGVAAYAEQVPTAVRLRGRGVARRGRSRPVNRSLAR